MTMIEKVARAIYEEDDPWHDAWPWPDLNEQQAGAEVYRRCARVAIEAMREPTVEMVAAFWRQKNTGTQDIGSVGEERSDFDAWRAAIDAALSEEPSP